MTASKPFSSPVQSVPSELSAEFERRVDNLLEQWQRRYAQAGVVDLCSRETDRYIAEYRVGKEMGLL